jgi:hypothetical protein
MMPEVQPVEYPFTVTIETSTGESFAVPIASLTREQVANFLQFDFKRLAQEAGISGARVHVQLAETADYSDVLEEVGTTLRGGLRRAA